MAVPIDAIENAIYEKRGNLAAVARSFGLTRNAIAARVSKSAKLQKARDEARETMLDNAETTLYDEALNGNTAALIFFLKTQGKSRGYIERTELTGADAGPVQVAHSLDLSEMSDDALRDSLAALSRVAAQLAADGRDADERDNGGTTDGHPAA